MEKEKSELERDLDYYKRKSEWFSKIIAKMQEERAELEKELEPLTRIKIILEDIVVMMFVALITAWTMSLLFSMIISLILNQKSMCL